MTAASRVMRLETVVFVELASLGTSAVTVRIMLIHLRCMVNVMFVAVCQCCAKNTVSETNECDAGGVCECLPGFSGDNCCTDG